MCHLGSMNGRGGGSARAASCCSTCSFTALVTSLVFSVPGTHSLLMVVKPGQICCADKPASVSTFALTFLPSAAFGTLHCATFSCVASCSREEPETRRWVFLFEPESGSVGAPAHLAAQNGPGEVANWRRAF